MNQLLSDVKQPVSSAKGLPNQFYSSDDTFNIEKQCTLFDQWAALCVGADIPNPGDALPMDFAGVPLLAVRDRQGSINVFENVCRHRGMILVDEKKNISGAIRCPYHSWCYGLNGKLVATPHVGGPGYNSHPGIVRGELGLFTVRTHVWRDIVFININNNAPEFTDYASKIIERWGEFNGPVYHGGADSTFTFEVECNWKLAVENYVEGYHLPWIHPGLNSYSRLEDHYNLVEEGAFSGQGSVAYRPTLSDSGERFVDFPGLSEKWNIAAEYVALYPNVLLGVHRDHAYSIILQPVSRNKTIEHVNLYYADESMRGDAWKSMREANTSMWHTVFEEDLFVVKGMQRGRDSVGFDGGKFSPEMDGPTHCFHSWVADQFARNAGSSQ